MAKKKKEQAVQEEPTKTVKTAAEEKPAKEKKTEAKAEVKSEVVFFFCFILAFQFFPDLLLGFLHQFRLVYRLRCV